MKNLFSRLATLAVGVALLAVGASGQDSGDAELNARLKKLLAERDLEIDACKELLAKNW